MKILRRQPECADLELEYAHNSGKEGQRFELDKAGCERVLSELRYTTLNAVEEILKSRKRLAWEKKNRERMPDQFDSDMEMTRDRIELEKSELACIFDQIDSAWDTIPEALRADYQNPIEELRAAIQIQMNSDEDELKCKKR